MRNLFKSVNSGSRKKILFLRLWNWLLDTFFTARSRCPPYALWLWSKSTESVSPTTSANVWNKWWRTNYKTSNGNVTNSQRGRSQWLHQTKVTFQRVLEEDIYHSYPISDPIQIWLLGTWYFSERFSRWDLLNRLSVVPVSIISPLPSHIATFTLVHIAFFALRLFCPRR